MVSVESEFTSDVLDLVHEGFDPAIRVGPLEESRLAARALGRIDYGLFACPSSEPMGLTRRAARESSSIGGVR
jgi:DNA-binding transcriptional LysR family regulator